MTKQTDLNKQPKITKLDNGLYSAKINIGSTNKDIAAQVIKNGIKNDKENMDFTYELRRRSYDKTNRPNRKDI